MIEEILMNLMNSFTSAIPNIIFAIVLLLIGLIIGKVMGRITREILVRSKIDKWIVEEGRFGFKFSTLFDTIVRWIIYLVFIQQAAIVLGVEAISMFVNSIIGLIPGLVEAALLVIIGYSIATYLKERISLSESLYSEVFSHVVFFVVFYLSIALALPFINIQPDVINNLLLVMVGSAGLGFAIAVGLGLKDTVRDMSKEYVKDMKRKKRTKRKRKR